MQFRFVGFSSWEDVISMNPIDLEDKLNSIDDRVHVKVSQRKTNGFNAMTINSRLNQYSQKLTVMVTNTTAKNNVLLFSLFKKRYGDSRWELDTRSNNPSWTIEYIDFYIKALQVAQQFMEDNNAS